MTLAGHVRDWEDLGKVDPLWAVLTYAPYRFGRWDATQFFQLGEREIDAVLRQGQVLGLPRDWDAALDFGCGVGRLTRSLARHFRSCFGVDIAESMIDTARRLNAHVGGCTFVLNRADNLGVFRDGQFDLVYSSYVLQHLPRVSVIRAYIREFVRVLRPGGLLVFQVPSHAPIASRLQPRRRLYTCLRRFGISERIAYGTLRLAPIRLTCAREADVVGVLEQAGATIRHIERQSLEKRLMEVGRVRLGRFFLENRVYYVTK